MRKKAQLSIPQTLGLFLLIMILVGGVIVFYARSTAWANEQKDKLEPWIVHPQCRCDFTKKENIICGEDGIYNEPITVNGKEIHCEEQGEQTVT
ncbi:hypothetical protein HOC35_05860 [Candidatus Woesearchaeota archaeon]|jgi:hypothetical protein|nr:hypothetical protein [Candidatus Woesearchaeota archaeon]